MYWFLWGVLVSYYVAGSATYLYLYKYRRLISYHFGMNMAMTASGVIGLATGIVLGHQMPHHYTFITIGTILLAVLMGILFGAMVDYQTVLTGVSTGIMAGLMGPMIGAMADQPMAIILFSTLLVYGSLALLCYSIRSWAWENKNDVYKLLCLHVIHYIFSVCQHICWFRYPFLLFFCSNICHDDNRINNAWAHFFLHAKKRQGGLLQHENGLFLVT